MNFEKFLAENYKQKLNGIDEAIKLIKLNCSNYNFDNLIYRGTNSINQLSLIDGSKGNRVSAHTSNYYTLILDEFLNKQNKPLRSKSIICTTNENYATNYGEMNIIIPYDDSKIGICPDDDIWQLNIDGIDINVSIDEANDIFSENEITDSNYNNFIKELKNIIKKVENGKFDIDNIENKKIKELCRLVGYDEKRVEQNIEAMYDIDDLGFKFDTGKSFDANKYYDNELWISGPCIMINKSLYNKVIKFI